MTETQPLNPEQQTYVTLPLRIGTVGLSHLRATKEAMLGEDAPEIALVEIDHGVFTLGGEAVRWAIGGDHPADLLDPEAIDPGQVEHSTVDDSVTLVLGQDTFHAVRAYPWIMDTSNAPKVALVQFGPVYRLGGDTVADYVEERGARAVWGSDIDPEGYDARGENTFN